MATSGYVQTNTEYDSYFFVRWSRTGTWNNQNDCGSTIYWEGGVHCGHSFESNAIRLDEIVINGQQVFGGDTYSNLRVGDYVLASGTLNISHNNDGTKDFWINGFSGWLYSNHNYWADGSWHTLDTIPRYPTANHSLNSKTLNSIKMNWSSDSIIDYLWYSTNEGNNWLGVDVTDGTSGTYTITGLNPNTTYRIKTRLQRKDSHLTKDTNVLSVTTYDIGRISSISNFNHGDDATLEITNPSDSSLSLAMKIGNTQILNKIISTGNNAISFTDEQLDNIYRLYGSSNSITATFILTTANNSNYTNSKTATITLTGNQKTFYAAEKKRAKVYVCVNGEIKRAITWTGKSSISRRCI